MQLHKPVLQIARIEPAAGSICRVCNVFYSIARNEIVLMRFTCRISIATNGPYLAATLGVG